MPAAAVLGGTSLLGTVASIYSGNKAADAQTSASKRATALQREQYQQGLKEVAPFKEVGINALPFLQDSATAPVTPFSFRDSSTYLNDYFNSPEYQALNSQATDQVLRGASATGGLRSGGANVNLAKIAPSLGIEALNRANQQDLQSYGVNQGAITDRFNRLFGVAGMGANVASGNQTAGAKFASQAGANAINAGQAQAANYTNQGNAISGLLSDAGSLYAGNKLGYFKDANGNKI